MHTLATGLLIGPVYFLVEKSGKLEGKSITRNMFWPGEWPN
jgi:hypothetical protein